jgi:hypothetical protein
MNNKQEILSKRFKKLENHYSALKDYKQLIDNLIKEKNIYDPVIFNALKIEEKAILDAYLKRFASVQVF